MADIDAQIRKRLENGYSTDVILQQLVDQGYDHEYVRSRIDAVQQEQNTVDADQRRGGRNVSLFKAIFNWRVFKGIVIGITVLLLVIQIATFNWGLLTILVIGGLFTSLIKGRLFSMGFAVCMFYLLLQLLGLLLLGTLASLA